MKGRAQAYLNTLFKTTQAATGWVGLKPSSAWPRNTFFLLLFWIQIISAKRFSKNQWLALHSVRSCSRMQDCLLSSSLVQSSSMAPLKIVHSLQWHEVLWCWPHSTCGHPAGPALSSVDAFHWHEQHRTWCCFQISPRQPNGLSLKPGSLLRSQGPSCFLTSYPYIAMSLWAGYS